MNINKTLGYFFLALVFFASSALAQDEFGSSEEGMGDEMGQDDFGSSEEGMDEGTGQDEFESSSEEMGQPEPAADGSDKPISLGVLLGYGLDFEDGDLNPFGFGFGIRGGYTLDMGLYLGAQVIYFIGDSVGESSFNVIPIGIEAGYDFKLEPIVIRPSLGLGLALAIFSAETINVMTGQLEDVSDTEVKFYIAPGASVIYPISGFFIGADLRFMMIFSDPGLEGLTIMANAGINL